MRIPAHAAGPATPVARFAARARVLGLSAYVWTLVWLCVAGVVLTLAGMRGTAISGGSMDPLIRRGDVVFHRAPDDLGARERLAAGTVITFINPSRPGGGLLTHRIIGIDEVGDYITRGDANASPDSDHVEPARVVGVGTVVVPLLGLPAVLMAGGEHAPVAIWLVLTLLAPWLLMRSRPGPPVRGRRAPPPRGWARAREPWLALASAAGVLLLVVPLATSRASFADTTANEVNPLEAQRWKRIITLDGGQSHSCLLRAEGLMWCWGRNDQGQLGDGTLVDRKVPVAVVGVGGSGVLDDLTAMSTGTKTSCAVDAAGAAWCWGDNPNGQLGNGTVIDSPTPVAVAGPMGVGALGGVRDIGVGTSHACAVLSTGAVWCWGRNNSGQLGVGGTTDSRVPVQVAGAGGVGTFSGAVAVTSGLEFTCVLRSDASVWCWGTNKEGQLGQGNTTDSGVPVQVKGAGAVGTLSDVVDFHSGESFMCSARTDGSAWCWGRNDQGQIGNGTTTTPTTSPVQVKGPAGVGTLAGVTTVGAGMKHACAVLADATAWCWGDNPNGQLGDGSIIDRTTPVQVKGPDAVGTFADASLVAGGDTWTCAARTDYTVWCWGNNAFGQLGDNTTTTRTSPVQTKGGGWTGVFDAVALAAGASHSCGVRPDGTVWCWGRNDKGQLGRGSTTSVRTPVQVKGSGGVGMLAGAVSVTAGAKFTCALMGEGTVWCWGENTEGQLGIGTTTNSLVPVQVKGPGGVGVLTGVRTISAGDNFVCAAMVDGSARCWGRNDKGQLGNGGTARATTPTQVKGPGGVGTLASVASVGVGAKHACGVRTDATLWCWGANNEGQLGDSTAVDRLTPVQVVGAGGSGTLADVSSVAGSDNSTCAAGTTGAAWCWGRNDKGQLGDGTLVDRRYPAVVVGAGGTGSLTDVATVFARRHACAVRTDSSMWCWGDNPAGQLGDGTLLERRVPTAVVAPVGIDVRAVVGAIAGGDGHTCALRVDGGTWCWGKNTDGQLGNGTVTDSRVPVHTV